jgi:hypothetical protein
MIRSTLLHPLTGAPSSNLHRSTELHHGAFFSLLPLLRAQCRCGFVECLFTCFCFGNSFRESCLPSIHSCDRMCLIGIQIVLIPFFLVICFSGSFRTSFLSSCCRLIIDILAIDSGSSWPCQSLVSLYCPHGFSHHSCNRCIAVFRRGYLFVRFIPDRWLVGWLISSGGWAVGVQSVGCCTQPGEQQSRPHPQC